MIHGIYIKNRPKGKWHLVSTTSSSEEALNDIAAALEQAKCEGYENAEVTSRAFETSFHIPELLNDVKQQKPMCN